MTTLMISLGIDRLNSAKQLQLVNEILDHLEAHRESWSITIDQKRDLHRRLAALEANGLTLTPWEKAAAQVLASPRR